MARYSYVAKISIYRAIKHLLEILRPYTQEKGGLLHVEHVRYVEGRGNLIITYVNVSTVLQ